MAPRLLTPADLTDPSKYTRSVLPVFGPHVRKWRRPDGTEIEIRVTAADLPDICEASNRPWRDSHTPARLTVGHVVPGMAIPEAAQARNVGYSCEFSVGKLNGKPWVFASLCPRADEGVVVGQYPFRSAEYDPETRRISGVALLTQDPFLDQGAVHYQRATPGVVYYTRAYPMAEETLTPEEEAQYKKFASYMRKKNPRLAAYMDDPSSTNTDVPNIEPGQGGTPYQRAPEYAALEKDNLRLTIERELDTLATVDRVRFDRAKELPALMAMDATKRAEHVAYMKANYGRLPIAGGFIPVVPGTPGRGGGTAPGKPQARALRPEEVSKVIAYQKQTGLPYEAARDKYLAEHQ